MSLPINDDASWERRDEEAELRTQQNRIEFAKQAATNRDQALYALESFIENMTARQIAEILWREREMEMQDPDLKDCVDRTDLARLVNDAITEYAIDTAPVVTAEDIYRAECEQMADEQREDA